MIVVPEDGNTKLDTTHFMKLAAAGQAVSVLNWLTNAVNRHNMI